MRKPPRERPWAGSAFADAIIASLPGLFYVVDEDGNYLHWNKNLEKVSGYSRNEIAGMTPMEFFPEEERDRVLQKIREVYSRGSSTVEAPLLTKDGRRLLYFFTGYRTNAPGKRCLVGMGIDISESKRAHEDLRDSREKYRLLVENQTDLVVKVDPVGRFQFVSPSYCELFDKTEAELIGRRFLPLVHEEDREATTVAMEDLYRPPYTCYLEQRALTRKGWRWLAWADEAVLDESGNVVAIVGVGRDITERKKTNEDLARKAAELEVANAQLGRANRELTQLDEMKSEFISNVSHELRTPLSAIRAYAELLADYSSLPQEERDSFVRIIMDQSDRLADVIEDLLDLSRIEAGEVKLSTAAVDLERVLASAIESIAPAAQKKDIGVDVEPLPQRRFVL
ncbi:MAG: PAS domain S-box protein, partial [Candidatus Eisenbacteria bacterium]